MLMNCVSASVHIGALGLPGNLDLPPHPIGMVVFVPSEPGSRFNPRQQYLARQLHALGLGTLMFDDGLGRNAVKRNPVLDIARVSACTADSLTWLAAQPGMGQVPVGLYGASTGVAAALLLAAREPTRVQALVAHGGRPDLAGTHLRRVYAPTLLLVDGDDPGLLELNRHALHGLPGVHRLQTLCASKNAQHEVDALNTSATLTGNWFQQHLPQTLVH